MSNVPLPRPGPLGLIQYAGVDMQEYAAAATAADNAALRERVKVLEDALRDMVIANERHSLLRVGDALTAARAALEKP